MADDLDGVRQALEQARAERARLEAELEAREAEARAPLLAALQERRSALHSLTQEVDALEAEATRLAVAALQHETALTRASYAPSPLRRVPRELRTGARWLARSLLLVAYLAGMWAWPDGGAARFGLLLAALPVAVSGAWLLGALRRG